MTLTYTIQSLSPIVTGDYDRRNTELLATGLLGSLRYQYWLIKAMEAWQEGKTTNKKPAYPPYSADFSPDKKIRDKNERLLKALGDVGPVVGLFGGTGWKRMFRLDITDPVPGAVQPASARSGTQQARHWQFQLCFSPDREPGLFAEQFKTTLEGELDKLMAFVHHCGWLGAAPQNGFGWVLVENINGGAPDNFEIDPDNPVFASRDVRLDSNKFKDLLSRLRIFYSGKQEDAARIHAPKWKKKRYADSLDFIDELSPPIGYEIRRWLYDQNGGRAKRRDLFGQGGKNSGYASNVHVSHPLKNGSNWKIRLRLACRPAAHNALQPALAAPDSPAALLKGYAKILQDNRRSP